MKPGVLVFAASCAMATAVTMGALATGCFQELDPNAASGPGAPRPGNGDDAESPDALTSWQLCQSPSCDSTSGDIPFLEETPPIYLPDAATTTDPCVSIEQASMAVRQTYCAGCHQAPADQGGMNFVLNDGQLVSALSQTATNDAGVAQRLLVPGDPLQSMLYGMAAQGLGGSASGMPPLTLAGYAVIPRPSASDLSVLYGWILACFPDAGGYVVSGGDYAPGGDAGEADADNVDSGGIDGSAEE